MSPPLKILTPLFYFYFLFLSNLFCCVYFGVGVLVGVGKTMLYEDDLFLRLYLWHELTT